MATFKRIVAGLGFAIGGLLLMLWAARIFTEFLKRITLAIRVSDERSLYLGMAAIWFIALFIPGWAIWKYFKWGKRLLAEMRENDARPVPTPKWMEPTVLDEWEKKNK